MARQLEPAKTGYLIPQGPEAYTAWDEVCWDSNGSSVRADRRRLYERVLL